MRERAHTVYVQLNARICSQADKKKNVQITERYERFRGRALNYGHKKIMHARNGAGEKVLILVR